uniref:Uncharacterized protein n=1 Tax=Romanomermis culicivorax TaxID=13658 RepID=A0A915JZJ5_ROMCU
MTGTVKPSHPNSFLDIAIPNHLFSTSSKIIHRDREDRVQRPGFIKQTGPVRDRILAITFSCQNRADYGLGTRLHRPQQCVLLQWDRNQ